MWGKRKHRFELEFHKCAYIYTANTNTVFAICISRVKCIYFDLYLKICLIFWTPQLQHNKLCSFCESTKQKSDNTKIVLICVPHIITTAGTHMYIYIKSVADKYYYHIKYHFTNEECTKLYLNSVWVWSNHRKRQYFIKQSNILDWIVCTSARDLIRFRNARLWKLSN